MKLLGREPVIIDRSQAYIGVLIDDLITKETKEPYRMMTSRSEYRLILRQDNADLRLTKIGYKVGLIDEDRYQAVLYKEKCIEEEIQRLKKTVIGANREAQELLTSLGSSPLATASTLADLIRRPELSYEVLESIDPERKPLPEDVIEQININLKYEGYIERQQRQIEQFKKMENKRLPEDMDYNAISGLRLEARQKLQKFRPLSIGQASRISGVNPADISVLMVYLMQHNAKKTKETNTNGDLSGRENQDGE